MGNYLKMEKRSSVEALLELGWSYRRIERETGVRRETIARYDRERLSNAAKVTAGPDDGPANAAKVTAGPGSRSQARPWHDEIAAGLAKGLTAQRIWQDLTEEHGYAGSYESVKRYAKRVKLAHPEVADVLHAAPGEEAQVDFFRGPPTLRADTGRFGRPWVFRMVLACSRHSYEEGAWGQDIASFIGCHENAFRTFGGVPKVVRLDNLKSGVARACLYDPDIAAAYASFACHYGFAPLPCRPAKPEEKGKVERGGGYLKGNALAGRRFDSISELNEFLARWNRTVASLRIHGTTKRQVIAHFLEVERPALSPLPLDPFRLWTFGRRVVHPDGHIQVEGAFYSVPHTLVGETVEVRFTESLLKVISGDRTVAVHARAARGSFSTTPEHRPAHKPARTEAYERSLLARAERIGPDALHWARGAIAERGVRSYRLLQGMCALTRTHPPEAVNWACRAAAGSGSFRYQTLKALLERAPLPAAGPELTQEHELIRPLTDISKEVMHER